MSKQRAGTLTSNPAKSRFSTSRELSASPSPGSPPSRFTPPLVLTLLALATFAAFAGVLRNGWIFLDDPTYIIANSHVQAGWTLDGFLWFLHTPHGGNWHPITSYSHLLDVQLFGLRAGAHHAVSLALHVANVLLLVVVLWRMTGDWWRSVLVGTLFGLHPLRVESVAWASERKDVLSMFFFLLTIDAYRRWVTRPGPMRYAAMMVTLALGLMSKPMLVTTPLVLMMLDLWPLGRVKGMWAAAISPSAAGPAGPKRSFLALAIEKWPLFCMAGASAGVTFLVQGMSMAIVPTSTVPMGHRLANAVVAYWRYIGKTVWPAHLIPYYPDAPVSVALSIACAAGLVVVSVLAFRQIRLRPHLTVGWFWYVVTLLPVIGLIQVGGQAYADRYTYIPTLGLLISFAWIPVPRRAAKLAMVGGLLMAFILLVRTRQQVALWKDTRTLFTYALRVTPQNAVAHNVLGTNLAVEHRDVAAIREFDAAIRTTPGYFEPYINMGDALHRLGRDAEAVRYYETALTMRPNNAGLLAHDALATLGTGRPDDAVRLYRRALDLNPDDVEAMRQLAIVRGVQGHLEEALPLLRKAELRAPTDPYTQYALAKAIYVSRGSVGEAVEHLRRAIRYKPDWPAPYSTLALILVTSPDRSVRDVNEAVRLATRAVELTGQRDASALETQAAALAAAGRFDSATLAARRALAVAERMKADSLVTQIRLRLATYEARANPKAGRIGADR